VREKIDQKKQREEERRKKGISALKDKQPDQKRYYGPSNLTEYLFADKYGEINDNINTTEINQIYMAYMQTLVDSYERLKSKFNQF